MREQLNRDAVFAKMREKGLTTKDVAELTGLSYRTVQKMKGNSEHCDPVTSAVCKVAEVLNCPVGDLFN